MSRRPPDAGTPNQWTIAGDARVVALPHKGLSDTTHVLIIQDIHQPQDARATVILTRYQAQTLAQALPAVVAFLEREEGA